MILGYGRQKKHPPPSVKGPKKRKKTVSKFKKENSNTAAEPSTNTWKKTGASP